MRAKHRVLTLAAALGLVSSMASGYYNWVFFAGHNGPYNPVPAKFDRNVLSDSTLSFFISDQPPSPMVPGDSFASLVNQIRAAADVWNQVPTSSLRLAFGGMETTGVAQSAPAIDVVFDDNLPPGLLAQTRPTMPDDLSFLRTGATFVPILRSRVQLRRDLTSPYAQPSYSDAFFLTIVHEFGHALGLQHTMTSGVMATTITRATTKAAPLAPDDVAGISTLYPAAGYQESTGAITGSVVLAGGGVNLASVVALSTTGVVISGMTNPDGTYRIGGVPSGQYYVYAHPLPPPQQGEAYPANIVPPQDSQKVAFAAVTSFDTQFYPGTRDWTQAAVVNVSAGGSTDGINFNMQRRTATAVPWMVTYGYQGQAQVSSPPLLAGARSPLVFYAPGTTTGGKLTPGLNVSVIGPAAQIEPGTLQYYAGTDGYAYFYVNTAPLPAATPVALAVTLPNDLYVLPAAFSVVPTAPPAISAVTGGSSDPQGNPLVTVLGTNLNTGTRIVFDGVPAKVLSSNSDGSLTVSAPIASAGYTAFIEALTADGQTSSQAVSPPAPPVFTYSWPAAPALSVTPPVLFPGTDSMIQIDAINAAFGTGQTTVGFGSSDIMLRRMWVVSPTRVMLNISVSPSAQPGPLQVTTAAGLQVANLATVLQMQAANPRQGTMRVPIVNQVTGLAGTPAGGGALISTAGLPANLAAWTLTIGGQKATFVMGGGNQMYVQVPKGLPLGPAVVQLTSPNGDQVPAVIMQIDAAPPVIQAAVNVAGTPIDSAHPVRPGDGVILLVSQLSNTSTSDLPDPSLLHINVGGVDHTASGIVTGAQPGTFQIRFQLSRSVPFGPQTPAVVAIDTRQSAPYEISILPQ